VVGILLRRPQVLVPADPVQPLAGEQRGGGVGDAAGDLLDTREAAQIEARQLLAQRAQVDVGVDEPRQHDAAREVDPLRRRPGQCVDFAITPNRDDAVAPDADRGGLRPRRVERHHAAVRENQIGGFPGPLARDLRNRCGRRQHEPDRNTRRSRHVAF
jgi:hypothetical protein